MCGAGETKSLALIICDRLPSHNRPSGVGQSLGLDDLRDLHAEARAVAFDARDGRFDVDDPPALETHLACFGLPDRSVEVAWTHGRCDRVADELGDRRSGLLLNLA